MVVRDSSGSRSTPRRCRPCRRDRTARARCWPRARCTASAWPPATTARPSLPFIGPLQSPPHAAYSHSSSVGQALAGPAAVGVGHAPVDAVDRVVLAIGPVLVAHVLGELLVVARDAGPLHDGGRQARRRPRATHSRVLGDGHLGEVHIEGGDARRRARASRPARRPRSPSGTWPLGCAPSCRSGSVAVPATCDEMAAGGGGVPMSPGPVVAGGGGVAAQARRRVTREPEKEPIE